MRLLLSLISAALSAQTLQLHPQTGTRPATPQQIADMQARLDANAPRGTRHAPVLPAIKIPAPPLRAPVPVSITNPSCRYFPFYEDTTPTPGTLEIDPTTGKTECVASTWSLGAIDGLPNRTIFEGTWEAIFSNDSIQYPNFTVQVVSNCGPSFGEVFVDWDTYWTTYMGTPAFQIAGNVYVDNGLTPTSLILVGEWTVFWEAGVGWVQQGGSVPAGGITCPAD